MSDKDKINEMIGRAFALASDNKHEYVTLEHVLFALLEDEGGALHPANLPWQLLDAGRPEQASLLAAAR